MKRILPLTLAILSIAAVAAADNDWVLVGHLSAHESKTRSIELTPGKTTIEVVPVNANPDNKPNNISCSLNTGMGAAVEENNVGQCLFNLDTPTNGSVSVKTTNNEDKAIEYRILVHETIVKK